MKMISSLCFIKVCAGLGLIIMYDYYCFCVAFPSTSSFCSSNSQSPWIFIRFFIFPALVIWLHVLKSTWSSLFSSCCKSGYVVYCIYIFGLPRCDLKTDVILCSLNRYFIQFVVYSIWHMKVLEFVIGAGTIMRAAFWQWKKYGSFRPLLMLKFLWWALPWCYGR